jgi:hypothetical protein
MSFMQVQNISQELTNKVQQKKCLTNKESKSNSNTEDYKSNPLKTGTRTKMYNEDETC